MLESIFESANNATISLGDCIICIGVAILLGIIISLTHKFTTKSTPNFLLTLAILPVLVQVVILLINGNLGTSLAVAGAFSLIRFRSMPGNSKEIISVFWAMTIGLALGMGYVAYSVIVTIIVSVLFVVFSKIVENSSDNLKRKLKVVIPENLDYEEVFNDIFEKYTDKCELQKVKTTNMGSMYELSYFVTLKKGKKAKELMDDIRVRNGNMLVMVERAIVEEEVL